MAEMRDLSSVPIKVNNSGWLQGSIMIGNIIYVEQDALTQTLHKTNQAEAAGGSRLELEYRLRLHAPQSKHIIPTFIALRIRFAESRALKAIVQGFVQ